METEKKVKLFLDSGAFSAFSQGVEIDIQEYIEFIKENMEYLNVYANLDVIGDPKETWKNQRIMEKAGLNPLPCFHYGEPIKYLERYLERYEYIAFGGLVPIRTKEKKIWLDQMFSEFVCDEQGMPKVKIHGYGMTTTSLITRYPWYSVDSTSWIVVGRNGGILVPRNGDFSKEPWVIAVSEKSPMAAEPGRHLDTLSPIRRKYVEQYIKSMGFVLGTSEDGEVVEPGVTNDYKLRDEINILFFLELEKSVPKWPWPFRGKTRSSLGL